MAGYCLFHKIPHYLPLRSETKIYQRRKVTVEKPVFPSYVFASAPKPQRAAILKSNNIVRVIEVVDQQRLLREIEQIRRALEVDPTLGATAAFTEGRSVRITGGPFRGLEGVVTRARGETRVVLNVQIIGQGVAVHVDMDALEPLD